MNKLIMLLESIKESNYIIEENFGDKEILIRTIDGKTQSYVIQFNTMVKEIFVFTYNNVLMLEDSRKMNIKDKEKNIKEFNQEQEYFPIQYI